MASNKEIKNGVYKKIKECARKKGWKCREQCIFKKSGDNFIIASFCFGTGKITDKKTFEFYAEIKRYAYDDIFWDVINMSSNKNEPLSLRAIGAFSAPSVMINTAKISGLEAVDTPPEYFVDTVTKWSNDFIEKYNTDDYILNIEKYSKNGIDSLNKYVLKCLAYINTNRIDEAVMFAESIVGGNTCGKGAISWVNEGKDFFEWLLYKEDEIYSIYGKKGCEKN